MFWALLTYNAIWYVEELYLWKKLITIPNHKRGLNSDTQIINLLVTELLFLILAYLYIKCE
jgi:hypothetical protein